jgi:antibiotic biosynthesis monooxygenase (ABM) superfamily enzyme
MPKIIKQSQSQTIRYDDDDDDRPRRRPRNRAAIVVVMLVYLGACILAWHLLPTFGIIDPTERTLATVAIGVVLALLARKLIP